jgi:hypothetical protein
MKQIATVRSNPYFSQEDGGKFELKAFLELVIIHTDGYLYECDPNEDGSFTQTIKLSETRMVVNPEMLSQLITELQLHQGKLQAFRNNADQINSLINTIKNER